MVLITVKSIGVKKSKKKKNREQDIFGKDITFWLLNI